MYLKYSAGIIEMIVGPMFSGKTTELIRRAKTIAFSKSEVLIFKPKQDVRNNSGYLESRNGTKIKTVCISNSNSIFEHWSKEHDVVAIDEAQFFDMGIVNVVKKLANKGVRVMISALDTDFMGEPFGAVPYLLSIADRVDKLPAVCIPCGKAATMSFRKTQSKEKIQIGDLREYEARCRLCHQKGMR